MDAALRRESPPGRSGLCGPAGRRACSAASRRSRARSCPGTTSWTPTRRARWPGCSRSRSVVIVKHNNPCGIGRGADLAEAYARALATDPVSAFGSVIALNRPADGALAAAMADLFVEVLLAPGFDADARARFGAKKNLRLIECPLYGPARGAIELRAIDGGFLAQPPDAFPDDPATWTCPTKRQPTPEERRALELAWRVVRYVKSNAIVVANADQTVGIGAGQMSRVDSCRLAVEKAQLPVAGCVAASDALLPLPRRPGRARQGGDHGGGAARREQARRRESWRRRTRRGWRW